MNILVIGSGGREHAIIKKLAESKHTPLLFCAPGNAGITQEATCLDIGAMDFDGIVKAAKEHQIELVVVGPDDPLCAGLVDRLENEGIAAFGPNKAAAAIEGSKVFSKYLMKKYGIPTAAYESFDNFEAALAYVKAQNKYPTVIKADGLALGKGVIIAKDEQEAVDALKTMFLDKAFGASGEKIVIEEFLTGVEISMLTFCDGRTIRPMATAKDHKKIFDRDQGPNTGGMGTIAPHPLYTPGVAAIIEKKIFQPTLKALISEGIDFKGVIFFGLILTADGPKMFEYNARFGDPETQVVLPLLDGDLVDIMFAVREQHLAEVEFSVKPGCAACVVLASGGYPGHYEKGYEIIGLDKCGAIVYHAGTKLKDGKIVTNGGRVLGVTATGDDLQIALNRAYEAAKKINFQGKYCRNDIGVLY
ncbi:MAG TPA: phosphoribosylamine--glycine ligase [Oscillospiraceae bacterium]|nr:phosphoribosylamine--glycine ligase [Oscillospiraceae bacterium]HPS33995.1 phosphoribosylamine--glycine ligase [Oscillospiraceae bacterium]